jgi:hypothetical protein
LLTIYRAFQHGQTKPFSNVAAIDRPCVSVVCQSIPVQVQVTIHSKRKFTQTRLVWATAGDGAAAGHGNLAEESYTAILEQAAGAVLGAAGIELTTRNYVWAGATLPTSRPHNLHSECEYLGVGR